MEKAIKFLGICILLSCFVVTAGIVVNTILKIKADRYFITNAFNTNVPVVFDRETGNYYIPDAMTTNGTKKIEIK